MCGIAGFILSVPMTAPHEVLRKMSHLVSHRGPDSCGEWTSPCYKVGFAHSRLSILDLSESGRQPMVSASGRYTITFNGEIYNHLDLRKNIESKVGANWNGASDTETLLACIDLYGIDEAVSMLVGMFAFAVYDSKESKIHLIRDRLGEKPLYYGVFGGNVVFSSEVKSMRCFPGASFEVDRGGLALYMKHNCVPAPYSIWKGIRKVSPGTILSFDVHGKLLNESRYWDASSMISEKVGTFLGGKAEAKSRLRDVLCDSVAKQMISDVPLGAFLSGGIDSSLIVALMQECSVLPVNTFSIGFDDYRYNEANFAKSVSKHLGTCHTEMYVSSRDMMEVVPQIPTIYDEPFSDSSQIPTYLVSHLAKKRVSVSLSGDGGDELFGGYNRHVVADHHWHTISRIPALLRGIASKSILSLRSSQWDMILRPLMKALPGKIPINAGDRLHKAAGVLASSSVSELYSRLVSHWDGQEVVLGAEKYPSILNSKQFDDIDLLPAELMMAMDMVSYLPDDILVKVDRASMANSLECRSPFLDHRVVEFAWSLPHDLKIRDGKGKWILRDLLYDYVPKRLIDRPKMGFGIPLGNWLRNELRDWAEDLLDPVVLSEQGYFNVGMVRDVWDQHRSGRRNCEYLLWDVLMFQSWLRAQAGWKEYEYARALVV